MEPGDRGEVEKMAERPGKDGAERPRKDGAERPGRMPGTAAEG